ncbi:hypothetical protein C8F04DRAFT_1277640 [Mycena alexandri]|uniref:Uncharacterized protein n=1 Tax=Mycena alexandri TaxID=1745969 RepID=A0AAD6RZM8_9AGAR|nr:hypothetical protein C8F04DRAFT_1277640 [Mycena alexandri]
MGTYSKTRRTRAANLLQNLSNVGARTKRVWDELSPKKLSKWLSPRKKHKENTTVDEEVETRLINDASDASIHMSDASHAFDASALDDPFRDSMQSFPVSGFASESSVGVPAARTFTWKVPKATVEEVEDDDDHLSTYTFPAPIPPRPFGSSSSSIPPSSASPPPAQDCEDPLDSVHVPEAEDELLATSPSHDDDYPRPLAPRSFLDRMHEQATRTGVRRQAPNLGEAKAALDCVQRFLRGELRGSAIKGLGGVGYKDPDISAFTRNRLTGIRTMLNFYVTPVEGGTYGQWGASARLAAHGLGRGKHCARVLAALARQFIVSREVLDVNPYGEWNESMLADENLANDIRLHLQFLGKEITAEKLCDYLNSPEVRAEHHIDKPVSLTTARRYLDELGYRFRSAKKGQYSDGHERPDVVYYRENVYLPRYFKLHERVSVFDNDGNPINNDFTGTGRRVIVWYHDESIFYAHDRRHKTWYHKDSPAKPYAKGEGHSFMVADYFSSDFGWLRDPKNPKRNARRSMRPGKGRDGYFTSIEVREQAAAARALVKELYPDFDHVFVYDNATTHKKRSEGSLSARAMPKGPSGTRKGFEASNFLVEINKLVGGKQVFDSTGKLVKEKIKMTGAHFEDGTPQDLYFPDDHPDHPGKFKGMRQILEERGMHQYANLRTECPGFKCVDPGEESKCCCRRVVFNLPDFAATKSLLEEVGHNGYTIVPGLLHNPVAELTAAVSFDPPL